MTDQPQPQPHPQPARVEPGCLTFGSLAAAAPFYLFTALTALSPEPRGPDSGMAIGLIMLGEIPLWFFLALHLWFQLRRARLPVPVQIAAWIITAFAAYASFWSFQMMGLTGEQSLLRMLAPLLLPPLAVLFGLWARRSAEQAGRRRTIAAIGFAAVATALIAPVLVAHLRYNQGEQRAEVDRGAEDARREAEFNRLVGAAGTRLEQLIPFLQDEYRYEPNQIGFSSEGSRRQRVLPAIQGLPSRQADAVRLIERGVGLEDLTELHQFNLEADDALCRAYRAQLDPPMIDPGAAEPGWRYRVQRENLEWLTSRGCDLSAPLTRAAAGLRAHPMMVDEALVADLERLAQRPAAEGVRTP